MKAFFFFFLVNGGFVTAHITAIALEAKKKKTKQKKPGGQ